MEDQLAKAAMPAKEETPTETEARLRAQVVATRENSIEDSLMQVDLNVRPQPYFLRRHPTPISSRQSRGFLSYYHG